MKSIIMDIKQLIKKHNLEPSKILDNVYIYTRKLNEKIEGIYFLDFNYLYNKEYLPSKNDQLNKIADDYFYNKSKNLFHCIISNDTIFEESFLFNNQYTLKKQYSMDQLDDFLSIKVDYFDCELIYGHSGCGKSLYIQNNYHQYTKFQRKTTFNKEYNQICSEVNSRLNGDYLSSGEILMRSIIEYSLDCIQKKHPIILDNPFGMLDSINFVTIINFIINQLLQSKSKLVIALNKDSEYNYLKRRLEFLNESISWKNDSSLSFLKLGK